MRRGSTLGRALSGALILGAAGVLLALSYSAYIAYPIVRGPSLSAAVDEVRPGVVRIFGAAERVSALTINNLPVPIDEAGHFSVERAYPAGYTVVLVQATDRFGRSREQQLTFVTKSHASKKENDNDNKNSGGGSVEGREEVVN